MKGLLAILAPKGKGPADKPGPYSGDSDADADGGGSDAESKYGDELAGILGIDPKDADAFKEALSGYVKACAGKE